MNGEKQGLGDPRMLEKIDKLFACNVGQYVNLPQIVVVGDQSSGKSSVLEGLIKMPLPRDSGLCTRFATQIIFRRSQKQSIMVSIIPDRSSSADRLEKLKSWKKELESLNSNKFTEIMSEVHDVMGLARKQDRTFEAGPVFSDDVLCLEISGPQQEHLSVIDVPGIFKNTSGGSTTKADMTLVQSMVRKYMENPRSAMLTVIPSNVDIATQEILEMAADVDPDGRRTLGVLTKPDLIDRGAEPAVVDLIEGRTHVMRLGWHLVRNPGQQQLNDRELDRDTFEQNFMQNTAPWKNLDPEKLGIESLRQRLQEVLSDLVRHEFPNVRSEILSKLKTAQTQLEDLGTERETPEQQSTYLMQFATKFQRAATTSIEAKYGREEIFGTDLNLRLATMIMNRNIAYANDMRVFGESYPFSQSAPAEDDLPPELVWDSSDGADSENDEPLNVRQYPNAPGVDDLDLIQDTVEMGGRSIAMWLLKVYETSRGFELGTFDCSILATTMKAQSKKWESITLGYVGDVISIIHDFILSVIGLICHDERVKEELIATLMNELLERYQEAIQQAQLLLSIERGGTPLTLNHYFNDILEKCRQKRMQARMEKLSFSASNHGLVVRVEDMVQTHSMSNTQHVVQEVHDILYSYYKVARKRAVDNVCMQVTDHFLVNGPRTPLNLFSPTFVSNLTTDQLEAIAGEDQRTKRMRKSLSQEIRNLTEARKIVT